MEIPFLISPYFMDFILPFVLVFVLIFAILQKIELFGQGKKQIDALVGAVIGLMLIAFPYPRSIIVLLMPFLAVSVVILLVFMLLYGFVMGKKADESFLNKNWKYAFGAIISVGLVSYLVYIAGYWDFVWDLMFGRSSGQIFVNVVLIVVIIGAIVAVIKGESGSSGSG